MPFSLAISRINSTCVFSSAKHSVQHRANILAQNIVFPESFATNTSPPTCPILTKIFRADNNHNPITYQKRPIPQRMSHSSDTDRFSSAIQRIDAANAQDPNHETFEGHSQPKELVYSKRMTRWLD